MFALTFTRELKRLGLRYEVRTFSVGSARVPFADPRRKELRSDVKELGKVLGNIIAQDNEKTFGYVEALRNLGKDFRRNGSDTAFEEMVSMARKMTASEAKGVSRAYAHFLALSNCAETHHRVRELEELRLEKHATTSAFPPKEDSCRGAISALLDIEGLTPQQVKDTLLKQRVEIVLTAHPTEINRRTVLDKHRRIVETLSHADVLDRVEQTYNISDATAEQDIGESYERVQLASDLRREVASLFFSDELRRFKPSPVHEAQGGLAVVESVLWYAVPNYLRKLDTELTRQMMEHGSSREEARLPLSCAPIRLASWIGGDRDGNPNVTPEITLQVSALNRWKAASLFLKDISVLYDELSIAHGFSEEVTAYADTLGESVDELELYRKVISHLHKRLAKTASLNEAIFKQSALFDASKDSHNQSLDITGDISPITDSKDLMEPLMAIYHSLVDSGLEEIADGNLADTIRRVAVFGVTMMPLDIRQESGRHKEAIDAITQYLGAGSYSQWTEDAKIKWLTYQMSNPRPLLPHSAVSNFSALGFSDTVIDTLKTFQVASQLGPGSLGAYVISQATAASDVLAVTLLQQEFGMSLKPSAAGEGGNNAAPENDNKKHMMRVVPLFETLDDLNNAPAIMERLLSLPEYMGRINGRVETMVGYSDSAKDAGRLAAVWAQYRCQEELAKVAKKAGGVELTFFHGKGGTVGRGGSPAVYRAVLSHPPNTIDGRFRVTEQGEMITQSFGNQAIAERTLDLYTAAVLREKHHTTSIPKPEWRKAMDTISEASCEHYRYIVREDPNFVPYFRAVTPEKHLSNLNVGSRPAKRNPNGGVESLRAIPWIFAWSQTRLHLPAWLGVSQGLNSAELEETLKDMYQNWPWFRELVELIAMILAKADPTIVENYDKQLIPIFTKQGNVSDEQKAGMLKLCDELRNELQMGENAVLNVSGQKDLTMGNEILSRELEVRTPYLDALNVVQCEVMRRLDNEEFVSEEEKNLLQDCLLITINGISAGMRNSG